METLEKTTKIQPNYADREQLYSPEEVFDRIDTQFVDFYGEYGRAIVNKRREEWGKENFIKLQKL